MERVGETDPETGRERARWGERRRDRVKERHRAGRRERKTQQDAQGTRWGRAGKGRVRGRVLRTPSPCSSSPDCLCKDPGPGVLVTW
jgi:hypothetical protein